MTDMSLICCERQPAYEGWIDEEASALVSIVEAVATVEEIDPLELDPLFEAIDPSVIDRLLTSDHSDCPATLHFTVRDRSIFIRSDGQLQVYDPAEQTTSGPASEKNSDETCHSQGTDRS
jgi:hypothetical protein